MFDEVDATFDQFAVLVGPLSGDFGDRCRAVAFKPRSKRLARPYFTCKHDLESPLT